MKALYVQQKELPKKYIQEKLENFLKEDKAHLDLTTQFSFLNKDKKENTSIVAEIVAEEKLVFVGKSIIDNIFSGMEKTVIISDGEVCNKGAIIATIKGNPEELLSRERVLLNLLQRLSGISSLTNKYVKHLNSTAIKILDTRKTTPGLRLFEKHAVCVGGGYNHRLDLAEGVMFKDNHLTITNGLGQSIQNLKSKHPNKKIQIEVDTRTQLKNLLNKLPKSIDAILLDNMLPEEVKKCSKIIRHTLPRCFIEVSGGINLNNILKYKNLDIDGISIGAITHQATSKNIKFEFKE